jgi:peptide/nickel transport system ATP-binding protein
VTEPAVTEHVASAPVMTVRDLTISVGGRAVVDGLSFGLGAGRVVALVGASGSGKTTTALALLGERPAGAAASGTVVLDGAAVSPSNPPDAGTVAFVPQQPSAVLNPVRRVGPVLTEIARLHVGPGAGRGTRRERRLAARERVLDALARAQVADPGQYLDRYPHQLSGGQQQRLVLAHELVGQPRVVIADEPTTGQDAVVRAELARELRTLADQGVAVLVLSHDLELVRGLADEILVLERGRLVESGPTAEVLAAPRHPYTRRLVEAFAAPPAVGTATAGDAPVLSVRDLVAGHGQGRRRTATVHGISLDVARGERIALVGRSGSGKTTLARCLAGLHPFWSGEVRLGEVSLSPLLRRRTRDQLARIQYVFQDARASFNEFVPVLAQVARTAERLRGTDPASARRLAVEQLGLLGVEEAVADRLPAALSGGELQRAALVRAALAEPEVLLCDEITSGLDKVTERELLDVLAGLQERTGCAVVLITHDLGLAARFTRRLLVLDGGRVVEEGASARVLADPSHRVTRELTAAARVLSRLDGA